MAKPEDTVKLVIGKELKMRFKSLCVQAETDMSSLANLIEQWCKKPEKKLAQQKKSRKRLGNDHLSLDSSGVDLSIFEGHLTVTIVQSVSASQVCETPALQRI